MFEVYSSGWPNQTRPEFNNLEVGMLCVSETHLPYHIAPRTTQIQYLT